MRTAVVAGLLAPWRMSALVVAGVGLVAVGVAVLLPAADPDEAQAVPAAMPAPALPGGTQPPRFDVVRVGPGGSAVLAGRAEPGAQVTVRDGEREVGKARVDRNGYWLLLPATPLPTGGLELTLSSRTEAGAEARGDGAVLLVVPEPARSAEPEPSALAVLVPDRAASRVLQAAPGDPSAGKRLGLNVLDYGDQGEVRFSGSAPAGAPVRVYVDNAPVGDAVADAEGVWTMTPSKAVAVGLRRLRVDQLSPQGKVSARVELPFQRIASSPSGLGGARVVVQPGQNLWQVARQVYGSGVRYTVIYRANRDQIRDPARIYPGQILAVPVAAQ